MSGDFSDDYQGLADWLYGSEPGLAEVGEPAYPGSFGWTPPLVPLPRRAPDELF
ncbi:hypothetical protein ABZ816_20960 [Actinosynnema sp. NPDC047251]|uniref:Uncharacterized protein n=1 Tax=Saccharothrix espanaensis (strain ATCC 51144 / DSM 44229 / JCM 9112 / NBRC 15066 / NRRL 15764) TaxID=1179773 RepID=K0KE32_SACES|nr:hypothetical protein [Saccharothrix espanaensis]CCH35034.1 hypothetical protein BN6_78160 [Saccharothrix espanaensis DSM 44229]